MTPPLRKNLVLLRAGDHSLHRTWLTDPVRDFDIFISYYGTQPNLYQAEADYYEMSPGPKWPCLGTLVTEHAELLEHYAAFWFPDDDLAATTATINQMFALFHGFRLTLAQPALTADSFYSWRILLQHPKYVLRYVDFVEIMAPIFDRQALRNCRSTFGESQSGYGLDFVWPSLLDPQRPDALAVLDATPVTHTRPVGGELYRNHPELKPRQDMLALLQKYGVAERKATGKYIFRGGVMRTTPAWWARRWMQLKSWNALRRLRREQTLG
ncbi:MAG: hypothetical protein WCR06_10410 [bacterium]